MSTRNLGLKLVCAVTVGWWLSWRAELCWLHGSTGLGSGHRAQCSSWFCSFEVYNSFFLFQLQNEKIPARRPQVGSGAKSKGDICTRVT